MYGDMLAVAFSGEILLLMVTWLLMGLCHLMGW